MTCCHCNLLYYHKIFSFIINWREQVYHGFGLEGAQVKTFIEFIAENVEMTCDERPDSAVDQFLSNKAEHGFITDSQQMSHQSNRLFRTWNAKLINIPDKRMSVTQSNRYFDHGNTRMFGITSCKFWQVSNCELFNSWNNPVLFPHKKHAYNGCSHWDINFFLTLKCEPFTLAEI